MEIRVRRAIGLIVGIAVALGLTASPARAVTLNADYASVAGDISGPAIATLTNQLLGFGENHGNLTTTVYQNAGGTLFTYEAAVSPLVGGISLLSTGFGVAGLTGSVGWSFADAANAGANLLALVNSSNVFNATIMGNGSLLWQKDPMADADCPPTCFWNTTDASGNYPTIRFFYQSTFGPGIDQYNVGPYNIQNSVPGSGMGLAPIAAVPEPGTLLLLSSGFIGAGLWVRRGRKTA